MYEAEAKARQGANSAKNKRNSVVANFPQQISDPKDDAAPGGSNRARAALCIVTEYRSVLFCSLPLFSCLVADSANVLISAPDP